MPVLEPQEWTSRVLGLFPSALSHTEGCWSWGFFFRPMCGAEDWRRAPSTPRRKPSADEAKPGNIIAGADKPENSSPCWGKASALCRWMESSPGALFTQPAE